MSSLWIVTKFCDMQSKIRLYYCRTAYIGIMKALCLWTSVGYIFKTSCSRTSIRWGRICNVHLLQHEQNMTVLIHIRTYSVHSNYIYWLYEVFKVSFFYTDTVSKTLRITTHTVSQSCSILPYVWPFCCLT
jgi:hypothetical protein